ncbi:MAG: agmatinase [Dethiobacteria bacterium]|jgi:agmatinase
MSFAYPPMERAGIFMSSGDELEKARGVILGAPLDDTGSFRPGTRFAPLSIRAVSSALEEYSINLGRDLRDISFFDAGDFVLPPGNTITSLDTIARGVSAFINKGKMPFILGGEHTVTLGAVQGCLSKYKEITVIFIDAHADMRPSYGGVIQSHASVAYLLQQLKGVTIYQFGLRSADREEMALINREKVFKYRVAEPLTEILPLLEGSPLYITIDMDVVDPAFAPGVAAPEPGGISSGELLNIFPLLEAVKGQIIALDLVEICPPYDYSQITALLGAKIIREALLTFL